MKILVSSLCVLLAAGVTAQEVTPEQRKALRGKDRQASFQRQRGQNGARRMMKMAEAKDFGKLSDGRSTKLYTIGNKSLTVQVSDYGGRIVRVYAPDRYGNLADVTLGWNTAAEYEKYGFSMGTLIGRYGNRIADGKFKLDGKEYQLPINEDKAPRHCNLHGGPGGWDTKIWDVKRIFGRKGVGLELELVSPDGDMNFPGTVTCKVRYLVTAKNTLVVEYEATTDKPTVINLTHHGYWNMAGEDSGDVMGQELMISADEYTLVTPGLIPIKNVPVKGTPFDFTSMCRIGDKMAAMQADASLKPTDNWFDHNYFLRGKNGEMTEDAWDEFLEALEFLKFNVIAYTGSDMAVKAKIAQFVKRQREDEDKFIQACMGGYSADHEGVISFANGVILADGTKLDENEASAWLAGAAAAAL